MQEKVFEIIFDKDEITWQTMIYELVKREEMDPWDVDVSVLAQRFLDMLKKLKEMDFRISGKILLAAAILLKLKSNRLVEEDLNVFDRLMASTEINEEEFYEELESELGHVDLDATKDEFRLVPRTPQPRKRKVSVYDLVDALQKALEVKNRRIPSSVRDSPAVEIPRKGVEISVIIKDIYNQIREHYSSKKGTLTFSQLLPSDNKEDKVYTFIPLLHLTNQRKIDLEQKDHFGEIWIELLRPQAAKTI
ncbi:MAG: segregation/condensation protein A [archaeon]